MIDLTQLESAQFSRISEIIRKSSEKSDLEKYYLFTTDFIEKGKIFITCYRLLKNAETITDDKKIKEIFKKEIDLLEKKYYKLNELIDSYKDINFNSHRRIYKIKKLIDVEVDGLIDVFSVLIERVNILNVSKVKGFVLDGKSGEAYHKIFGEEKSVD